MVTPLETKADTQWYHCYDCGADLDGAPEMTIIKVLNFEGTKEQFENLDWDDLTEEETQYRCGDCGSITEEDFVQIDIGDVVYRCGDCGDDKHDEETADDCCT